MKNIMELLYNEQLGTWHAQLMAEMIQGKGELLNE